MNAKQLGLGIVLAGFATLTGYDLYLYGLEGFFRLALANAATVALFADLVIALTMVVVWMGRDAAQRGVNAVPYLILTLAFGSIGPLLYLIGRFSDRGEKEASTILHPHEA